MSADRKGLAGASSAWRAGLLSAVGDGPPIGNVEVTPKTNGADRVSSPRRCPMLEPDAGKLASPVLRGGGSGNWASLPDLAVTAQ